MCDSQIDIPPSFMALFVRPGQTKPSASHQEVAQRYEICEDMANLLTEQAQSVQFSQGLETHEVLARCHQALLADVSAVSAPEAEWVIRRLAELLNWDTHAPS
jgi:hypothetical protein